MYIRCMVLQVGMFISVHVDGNILVIQIETLQHYLLIYRNVLGQCIQLHNWIGFSTVL